MEPIPDNLPLVGREKIWYDKILAAIPQRSINGIEAIKAAARILYGHYITPTIQLVESGDAASLQLLMKNIATTLAVSYVPYLPINFDDVIVAKSNNQVALRSRLDNRKTLEWFFGLSNELPYIHGPVGYAAHDMEYGHSVQSQHVKSLLIQYSILYKYPSVPPRDEDVKFVRRLGSFSDFMLSMICEAIVSEEMLYIIPPGRAALLFSILTGRIITFGMDANISNFYEDANKLSMFGISTMNIRYANSLYLLAKKRLRDWSKSVDFRFEHLDLVEFITSDCYTSLSEKDCTLWSKLVLAYVKTEDKPNGFKLRKRLLTEAGMYIGLYKTERENEEHDNTAIGGTDYIFTGDMSKLVSHLVVKSILKNRPDQPPSWPVICLNATALSFYNDFEIATAFIPRLGHPGSIGMKYDNREDFLADLLDEYQLSSEWSVTVGECMNSNYNHLVLQESRGQVIAEYAKLPAKDKGEDAFLAYGPDTRTYAAKCYQVSELEAAFDDQITGFEFRDPDWSPVEQRIDRWSGRYVNKLMSRDMILSLFKFLRKGAFRRNPSLQSLLRKMEDGVRADNRLDKLTDRIKLDITDNDRLKFALSDYMCWLFLLSMWIRFWKGPGHPYPVNWQEQDPDSCVYNQRDENVSIELLVHRKLLDSLDSRHPGFKEYVVTLPYIYHSWATGESKVPNANVARELVGAYTIEEVIDKVSKSEFCMAQATDILSGTAFAYLTLMLDVKVEDLNDHLTDAFWVITDFEIDASKERMAYLASIGLSVDAAEDHRNVFLTTLDMNFTQPPIDISQIVVTRHLPFDIEALEIGDFEAPAI